MKIFFVALLLCVCVTTTRAADEPITQIQLQHTQCYGTCPIDEVTFRSDGNATFSGVRHSAREGFYHAQIAPATFAQLASALENQNFFELRPEIGNARVIDAPDTIVSATRAGSLLNAPHTVVFRANQNRALLAKIEAAFGDATAQIGWQKDEIASDSGARGTLTRDLTPYETQLFADREMPLTNLRMNYALVTLTSLDNTQTAYSTHSDGEGNYQIFAPPGRYLFSANGLNAARTSTDSAYSPLWLADGKTIEITANQFAPIELRLSDFNENTKPKIASKTP